MELFDLQNPGQEGGCCFIIGDGGKRLPVALNLVLLPLGYGSPPILQKTRIDGDVGEIDRSAADFEDSGGEPRQVVLLIGMEIVEAIGFT